jgi:hypothetical protein
MSEINDFPFSEPIAAAQRVERRLPRLAGDARGQNRGDMTWNVLTVLVWVLMVCAIMAFISIYMKASGALNPSNSPYSPTLVSALVIPTRTASPQPLAAEDETPTATATLVPPTPTLTPTATPIPTETATPGPSPTPTIYSLYPFILRGEIRSIDGATFHDHEACRLWVAGQAYDLQGAPMTGITVMLGGWLDGKTISQLSLTGTALQYGQAGYEFTLAEKPADSREKVWVQLFDQAMIPLSSRVFFDTQDDCSRNLILINFRQVR